MPEQRDGYLIYRVDRPDLKAQLVTRNVDGRSKAVTVACSYPHDGEHWQLFELTPRESPANADGQAAHLLPLPEGVERRGGRFADDGRLLLELITLDSKADSLVATWKNAGWEVRPSGLGEPGSFSFLCARGSEVIYAWSANSGESIQNLMLVRSPTDAELKAQQLIPKD